MNMKKCSLKNIKNPRLYSIALRKFVMNLFHKNIDLLRDAFNKWKKIVNKEKITFIVPKKKYQIEDIKFIKSNEFLVTNSIE